MTAEAARVAETNPGEHTARRGAGSERACASSASWRSKTSGAGEERENFEKDPTLMGATRAALRRRGREQAEERGPRAGERLVVELDGDGEGGGRRRWEGAPAAVAGDGAARKRQVARPAAAGRDHRQGPQELRAHAQPAARHQVTHPRAPPAFRFFSCHARC
jgi:hypothetical protein